MHYVLNTYQAVDSIYLNNFSHIGKILWRCIVDADVLVLLL